MLKSRMKSVFQKFQNSMSFGTRVFFSFFCVGVPIIIIVSAALYIFLNRSGLENISRTMLQTMEQISGKLEYVIEDTENLSRNLIYDSDVQKLLNEAAQGESYPETDAVKYFINSFIVNREYIEGVVLMGQTDTLFSTELAYTNVSSPREIRKKWWFNGLTEDTRPYTWYSQAKSTEIARFSEEKGLPDETLMLTRRIRSVEDYMTPVGRMMIYLKNDYMMNLITDVSWGNTPGVWVCEGDGDILLYNMHAGERESIFSQIYAWASAGKYETDSEILTLDGRRYVCGAQSFGSDGWKLIMAIPLSEVNDNASIMGLQIISMIAVILLIIVIVATVISHSLSKPIRKMSKVMDSYHNHQAGENPVQDSKLPDFEDRKDEIGTIYRSYEQMVSRVDTLIREIYLKDLEKKDAELALMQSQINPHFLYNTLDSINWMAMANGQDEISEMVTALSDTFRLSLKKTNSSYILINQEIEYLNSYLTLQKYRFGGRLECEFHVPDDIRQLFLLRFLLQPVVENAIKHGIALIEEGGKIDIIMNYSEESEHVLEIHVINDGDKIDLDAVGKLLGFNEKTQTFLSFDQNSYGLQNINRRIKIVHGSEYGVFFSVKDGRTDCTLLVPVEKTDPVMWNT